MTYNKRHGGPFDRGGADYYYGRGCKPHFYVGNTYSSDLVDKENMTKEEIQAYMAGYEEAEESGDRKIW